MFTAFDGVTLACFASLVLVYFAFTTRELRTLLHFMVSSVVFAVANQVGNAGSVFLGLALITAGAAYAAIVILVK